MGKITKKKKLNKELEHYIKTKVRLRLGSITLAPFQTILVAKNHGFNGKKNLGYYFYHKGKKICLREKDVNYIGTIY